jgi:hypothetical protein
MDPDPYPGGLKYTDPTDPDPQYWIYLSRGGECWTAENAAEHILEWSFKGWGWMHWPLPSFMSCNYPTMRFPSPFQTLNWCPLPDLISLKSIVYACTGESRSCTSPLDVSDAKNCSRSRPLFLYPAMKGTGFSRGFKKSLGWDQIWISSHFWLISSLDQQKNRISTI